MTGDPRMSNEPQPAKTVQRRGLFSMISLGGVAAAATAVVSVVSAEPAEAMTPSAEKGGAHYRESEHIKQYYHVNRY
jgi:hypothetical protein